MNKMIIYQDMTIHARKPFRIVEVFPTVDGHRTRLSSLCFETYDQAHAEIMRLEKEDEI